MAIGGAVLRISTTGLRAIEFCASIIILGIFAYFLAALSREGSYQQTWIRAVEGISGAASLYTIIAVLLTCFLGGKTFFAFLAIILDICFIGCFIAVAILTRRGVGYGNDIGIMNTNINQGILHNLEAAAFALAIINIGLFILSAVLQLYLGRYHQKEQRHVATTSTYTSNNERRSRFPRFGRNKETATDTELGTTTVRPSHDTVMSGATAVPAGAAYNGNNNPKYTVEPVSYQNHPGSTQQSTLPGGNGYENQGYGQTQGYDQTQGHGHTQGYGQHQKHGQTEYDRTNAY